MTDAELVQRYRRALAEIMTVCGPQRRSHQRIAEDVEIEVLDAASRALFGDGVSIWTDCNPPPIPDRSHDWSAIDEATYGPGAPVGEGGTEVDAILDLLDKLEERE